MSNTSMQHSITTLRRAGGVFRVTTSVPKRESFFVPRKRGEIKEFSANSRRRLRRFLGRVRYTRKVGFLTVTLRRSVTYGDIKAFREWLRRRFPTLKIVWKKEFQRRGAVHFHLLFIPAVFIDLKEVWQWWISRGCGSAHIDYKVCHHRQQVAAYLSKYVAKPVEVDLVNEHNSTGRFWGYFGFSNDDLIDFADIDSLPPDLLSFVRSYFSVQGRIVPHSFTVVSFKYCQYVDT